MTLHSAARQATIPVRANSLSALVQGRRSVRQYVERSVNREDIETILEAARWAPSPHGRQPWRFAVITRSEV
ncbi:MAG TPA: nitroreductase family protein, partial [Ktedonobacteraceae bacterium]|nr:nitroreductase family protein [Ktedonobacteraceae bacterium]